MAGFPSDEPKLRREGSQRCRAGLSNADLEQVGTQFAWQGESQLARHDLVPATMLRGRELTLRSQCALDPHLVQVVLEVQMVGAVVVFEQLLADTAQQEAPVQCRAHVGVPTGCAAKERVDGLGMHQDLLGRSVECPALPNGGDTDVAGEPVQLLPCAG